MTTIQAHSFMNTHVGDLPLTGYIVQRRGKETTAWIPMAPTWDTLAAAKRHLDSIAADKHFHYRLASITIEPVATPATADHSLFGTV